MNLVRDVLEPVFDRIESRRDSLCGLNRFKRLGIEGWLKVEAVAALGEKVEGVQNHGPDLSLRDAEGVFMIELKAATDLNPAYLRDGATKYASAGLNVLGCLFLGDGSNPSNIAELQNQDVYLAASRTFDDGRSKWIVGFLRPKLDGVVPEEPLGT